jgi:uncharacterized phage protein (TIGR02216 family)
MRGLDWPALMHIGLGKLRLRPEEFWRLTPIEFLLLSGLGPGGGSTTRAALEQLCREFPDRRKSR